MRQLYVYYRIDAATLPEVAAAVRSMQAALRAAHPGLATELLRRPDSRDGELTLMETYAAPGGIVDALQRAIERAAAALVRWQSGPRHTEVFEPLT